MPDPIFYEACYNAHDSLGEFFLWGYAATRFPASITFYPNQGHEGDNGVELLLSYIQPVEGTPND